MDHIGKAFEKARANPDSVRDWMKPVDKVDLGAKSAPTVLPKPAGQVVSIDPSHLTASKVVAQGLQVTANPGPALLRSFTLLD